MVALDCRWLDLKRPLGLIRRCNDTLGRTARGVLDLILGNGDSELAVDTDMDVEASSTTPKQHDQHLQQA